MTRPYVVWSPPWDHRVGGIRALYRLVEELQSRGLDAAVASGGADPESIVVYPEIVPDNPFRSERVVRWRLAPAEVPDDGFTVDWLDYGSGNPVMMLDLVDEALFARREGPRDGVVVWTHKGTANPDRIPSRSVQMTADWPESREAVADLLAGADYLMSFDEFSTVNLEAMLLGTPVLLYPTAGKFTRAELETQPWSSYGVAWSHQHLELARAATAGAWDWYRGERERMAREVDAFVERTQALWPSCG